MKILRNENITIAVKPLGAELASIRNSESGYEYLWQADPVFWKRHSPILFPIVGSVWNGEFRCEDKIYKMSQHGFARDMEFSVLSESPHEVFFELTSNTDTMEKFPDEFTLVVGYRLKANTVEVIWQVENTGEKTLHFQIGAHPAFNYKDFDDNQSFQGYLSFNRSEGLNYNLISKDGCVEANVNHPLNLEEGLLTIDSRTFEKDALILENNQVRKVSLLDKSKRAYVTVHFDTPVLGLWSPPSKNAPFVCIEPWYGRCDRVGFDGKFKDRDWVNSLPTGEIFRKSYIIEVG